jgi:hypothetical protein
MTINSAETNAPQVYDETGKNLTPPPPAKIDLHDANAIRREMASVYRDMRNGKLETGEGTKLVYVLDMLRKSLETCELQKNLELLKLATTPPKERKR